MKYRLYQGDCLDILPTLTGVDAVVTDPPYGISLRNHGAGIRRISRNYGIQGDDSDSAALFVLEWAALHKLPTVAFSSPWRPWPGEWRNLIVWDKGGAVGGGGDIKTCLKRTWELIQVARNKPLNGGRSDSVWRFPIAPQYTADHIAAKPVALMRELIVKFTNPGDTILDPFMGSGSTGVAALMEGRSFIGIDTEAKYVKLAGRRIEQVQPALIEVMA
jgi:site-specific DNA-methyltransferase (adenine-specific)